MIIGIAGRKQAGKNTLAKVIQYLISQNRGIGDSEEFRNDSSRSYTHTSGWQTRAFADKLKNIVCLLIGCTREQLEDNDFKETPLGEEWNYIEDTSEYGQRWIYPADFSTATSKDVTFNRMTPRKLLQLMGTQCGRNTIHPNIWVSSTMSEYRPAKMSEYNPSNWIITDCRFPNEAKAIKDRDGLIFKIERPNLPVTNTHESETGLDNYQYFDDIIYNRSDINFLIETMKQVLKSFKII